jgi:hypothetical protein
VPELPSAVGANRESVRVYDLRNATLAVRPGAMRFTKVAESTMQTPPQSLVVQVGGFKPVDWTLQVPAGAPIQATQRSARGSGRVDVALAPDSPTEGAVVIQVRADQRDPIAVPVRWRTVKREMLQPPIGSIDVPPGDTISFPSSISGWTLDDVGVTQILFVGVDGHGRRIELATTHDFGWRSDLERIYQHLPGGGRGAWSQLLPPPSADVAAVQVVAEDVDGHRTVIGSRRVVK